MEAAAVAAVATGSVSERDDGCLVLTTDVAAVADADADDGSFVVLVDMSPDLLRLIFGLVDDAQLLELDASLSASCTSFLLFLELDLGGIMN